MLSFFEQSDHLLPHLVEHRFCQTSSLGVLPAGVVGSDQPWQSASQAIERSMRKCQPGITPILAESRNTLSKAIRPKATILQIS
jgi:hypothetical protein